MSLVSDTLDAADPAPSAWLDKTFLQIGRIKSVAVASGSAQWKFARENENSNEWKLDGIKEGEKLDNAKIPAFASILTLSSFADVNPTNTPREGLDKTVTVTTFDGFTYTLNFGQSEGANVPLAVAVAADFLKERAAGKDEKPEDKKRLDDEFAAKSRKLEETLARAKARDGRVYLVTASTLEPLWKPREEFIEKPAAAASPSLLLGAIIQGYGPDRSRR